MLGGDNHGIHSFGFVVWSIFHCDLRFSIRTEIRKHAVLTDFREPHRQLVRQIDGRGHVVFIFVGGVTEHHALVAGAAGVHAHGDVTGLLIDAGDHGAGVGVKTIKSVVITNRLDHAADYLLEVHISFGGNFDWL